MSEQWTFDGVSLNTLGFNISTASGRNGLPELRGENDVIPYRPGSIWVPKTFGQRDFSLSMWIVGANEDGTIPTTHSQRAQFNANEDKLLRLFSIRHRLIDVERVKEMPAGPLILAGQCEVVGRLSPSMMAAGTRGTFTVDLVMPDPWWYASQRTEMFDSTGTVLDQPGSAPVTSMLIELVGPLTFPRVKNVLTGVEVRYGASIPAGKTVVLDTGEFTAMMDGTSVIGKVRHVGAPQWMILLPGPQAMVLDNWQGGTVGGGNARIVYRPPYIS